jgi:hypothetical protein
MTKQSIVKLKSPTFKVGLFCFLLLVSACNRVENPDDVTIAFWTALAENNYEKAAEYSTEGSASLFNEKLLNSSLQIGRVKYVCDGATVETYIRLQSEASSSSFKTILIRDYEENQWKVDYPRTIVNINAAIDKRFKNIVDTSKEAGKTATVSFLSFIKELGHSIVTVLKNLKDRLLS